MIKDRIVQLIEYKRIAKEEFYKKIQVTSANFRGKAKESDVGSITIAKILSNIPDANPIWLITGQGEMLLSDDKKSNNKSDGDDYKDKYFKKLEELDVCKSKIIELQEELLSQQGNEGKNMKVDVRKKGAKSA